MKKTFLFIVAILVSYCVSGQDTLPKGVYMTLEEIRSVAPSQVVDLTLTKRKISDIKMSGGNDYRLESEDKAVSKRAIKRKMLAYSTGEQLFVNGLKYGLYLHYCRALSVGRYIAFRGSLYRNKSKQNEQLSAPNYAYLFGGIGGGIRGAQLATIRLLYVIDTETGESYQVSDGLMRVLLQNYEELLNSYSKESHFDELTFVKYLKLLNETEAKKKL